MVNDDWQSQMERYLAHFSRAGKRQTILFTHHARVAERARGLTSVEVVEM